MKIGKEFKIGIFAIIVIGVSWWGIKWLGGQDILKRSNSYYVYYDDVTGLQESSRVKLRGVSVGNVQEIELLSDKVKVELSIEAKYADMIPANSIAEIGSSSLMGGMEIYILQGDSEEIMANGGTIEGRMRPDMLGTLADKGGELIDGLNQTVSEVNTLLSGNGENISQLIANLESMTASIDGIMASSAGDITSTIDNLNTFTTTLAENTGRLESMLANIDTFSSSLANADIVNQLNNTVKSLNEVLSSIEGGEGSVGKLLTDDELYNSLNSAGENLSLLLEDLKAHPMRYVHFSLFGQSEAKVAKKEAKEAEKEKRKAAKESAK